jgi:FRG domain
MKEIYESNWQFTLKWLEDAARILHSNGVAYKTGDNGPIDKIYKAITELNHIEKIPASENIPKSNHFQVGKQWIDFAYNELLEFNARGDEYICSTTEALIKCNSIKRLFDGFKTPLYFRGEHNFGWELIPRLGRQQNFDWTKEDPNKVTKLELELVKKFQDSVKTDKKLSEKIFGLSPILDDNNPGWWSIMQHYDDLNGTRMLDVTSSIFCSLYFACANWDGTIDNSVDGKLYMFPYALGRGETETPERIRGQLVGAEDELQNNITDYFSIEKHIEIPRFRKSPIRNDRVISQDGLFVWQAKFNEPLSTFQIFPFRVHRDFKKSIIAELDAMGFTKDRILFENRFRKSLDGGE